jgi:hypothetical protein
MVVVQDSVNEKELKLLLHQKPLKCSVKKTHQLYEMDVSHTEGEYFMSDV